MTTVELGTTAVAILIPSRRKDGGFVDPELRREWQSKAREQLESRPFGGASPTEMVGSYVDSDDQRVTREDVTVLSCACGQATVDDQQAKARILAFAHELCAALGQDSVFVRWGDEAILVQASFNLADVRVMPFNTFPDSEQPRLATLGWAGLPRADKILQLLSLDTWTLPDESRAPDESGLSLVAVLHEDGSKRRAWSLAGSGGTLRSVLPELRRSARMSPGDLVFADARDNCIEVVLVTPTGLAGPHGLRKSHGQLNPVTRQLLLRILRRQWGELEEGLSQKEVTFEFFPKLQQLREHVNAAALRLYETPPVAVPARGKKAKAPLPLISTISPERKAFRQSVLVVGRMVFLRFLAQKGWIPGGVDELVGAYERYGDTYFKDYIQPLWFHVLNTPVAERSPDIRAQFSDEFHYLNGGLFQPRPEELALELPGRLFDPTVRGSFLQLFRDYKFSLNEYAGSDESLAIDPSLFGRVLESFNPDVERKNKGVHYTPKPIAWAMALEAVLERLSQVSGIDRDRLLRLMKGDRRVIDSREASGARKALESMRIIDPAVGSGVLLWAALEVLLAIDSACDGILGRRDGYQRGSQVWGQRSRHFVCNCLYGVDISEEAIELTRLRLWLSVAMSEDMAQPEFDSDQPFGAHAGHPARNQIAQLRTSTKL
jgi:hypothetical protein